MAKEFRTPLKIVDGSQGADKVLASDANGQSLWRTIANILGFTPANVTGANATGTWPIGVTGKAARVVNTDAGVRIAAPGGGAYAAMTAPVTGAIKIKLPVASWKSNTMLRFTVRIYEYAGGASGISRTIEVGGYNYNDASASWHNYFATDAVMGVSSVNVRFGNDGTSQCIWIGDTTSTWQYPQVFITDFQGGFYAATEAIWATGWAISFVTAFDTVTEGPIVAARFWHQHNDGAGSGLDSDLLDGYHANTGTTGSTIPVRAADGSIPGNIGGNAATATSLTAGDKTVDGSLTLSGTARRVYADFANATIANRFTFQNSTPNSSTYPQAAPSGSGAASGFLFANSSDFANFAYGLFNATSVYVAFSSGKIGSATYLPFKIFTGGAESASVDDAGRVYLPRIHNNASGLSGTTPAVGSGTYTPTITGVTYVSGATAYAAKWTRTGNIVRVTGYASITFMSGYDGQLGQAKISLPITSNLAQSYDAVGLVNYLDRNYPGGAITASIADDTALLQMPIQGAGSHQIVYDFSYEVL